MLYFLYSFGFWLTSVLSIKQCYTLAAFFADCYYAMAKRSKDSLRDNLNVVLGPHARKKDVEKHLRRVFVNFAKYLSDFMKFFNLDKKYLDEHVELVGAGYIDECLAGGKGAILVSAHLGNWELGGAVVAAMGYPMNAIVLEHEDKKINDIFQGRRRTNKLKIIPLGMQLKKCFKALKNNEVLAVVADKDYTGDTVPIEFFGKKTHMPKGPAVLSLKTGAPLVVCSLVRKKNDKFKLAFDPPITQKSSGDYDKDVHDLMKKYLEGLERHIRANVDQWYTFERIWK